MKATQLLMSLINTISEQRPFEAENTKAKQLYQRICDILSDILSEEQQELIFALDDMVSITLSKMFNDGIITGMELTDTMQSVISEPETIYREMLNHFATKDYDYHEIQAIINKHKKAIV